MNAFPDLKLIAAHLGAWNDWDEVKKYLLGKPIYMDISYSIDMPGKPDSIPMMSRREAMVFLAIQRNISCSVRIRPGPIKTKPWSHCSR